MNDPDFEVKKNYFFSSLRANLFNQITRRDGGCSDWRVVTGRKSRNKDGTRASLSDETQKDLQRVTDYYNTEEGLDILWLLGLNPPEHYSDVIEWVNEAVPTRQMNSMLFKHALSEFRRKFACNIFK